MKIAIDIHGAIDVYPRFFSWLTKTLHFLGVEIHITTGVVDSWDLRLQLGQWGIRYDYLFSITSYHKLIGTPIRWDEDGDPWIEETAWNRTKGDYCHRKRINYAIDDTIAYKKYFVETKFILFGKGNKDNKEIGLPFADWLIP